MPPIHNHYVPAYYLSGFTEPDSGQIFMYFRSNKKVIPTRVASVANEIHYWSDEIEKFLAEKIENPATAVFQKIGRHEPLIQAEKIILSRYIVTMIKRVPAGRSVILSLSPDVLGRSVDRVRGDLAAIKDVDPSASRHIDEIQQQLDDLLVNSLGKPSQATWEKLLLPEMSSQSEKFLSQMRWTFFTAPKGFGYLTSDNPVVFSNDGFGPPAGRVIFPLNQSIILFAHWDKHIPEEYVESKERVINEMNYWTAAFAVEYIFYSRHKNGIEAMIKKANKMDAKKGW